MYVGVYVCTCMRVSVSVCSRACLYLYINTAHLYISLHKRLCVRERVYMEMCYSLTFHIYIYIYIYIYMYVCMYVYIYIYIWGAGKGVCVWGGKRLGRKGVDCNGDESALTLGMWVCMCVCVCMHMYTCRCVSLCLYVHICTYMHIHTYRGIIYIHTYLHTHIYIYTHLQRDYVYT